MSKELDMAQIQAELERQREEVDQELFRGKGKASIRRKSKNEELIEQSIDLVQFYNDNVVPRAEIFKPMTAKAGICPFHNDTDPSLIANMDKKYYHCFGCGFTGGVIEVYRQLQTNYENRRLSREEVMQEIGVLYALQLGVEERDEVSDKFAMARKILLDKHYVKEYTGGVTLSQYKNNNQALMTSGNNFEALKNQLGELDMLLAVYLDGE